VSTNLVKPSVTLALFDKFNLQLLHDIFVSLKARSSLHFLYFYSCLR
jgi:hypothetical protein